MTGRKYMVADTHDPIYGKARDAANTAFGEWIRQQTHSRGFVAKDLGALMGVSGEAVRGRFVGRREMTVAELIGLCARLKISLDEFVAAMAPIVDKYKVNGKGAADAD